MDGEEFEVLAAHVREHGGKYFDVFASGPVEVTGSLRRAHSRSRLYRLDLSSGTGQEAGRRAVVAKVFLRPPPASERHGPVHAERPRLSPVNDAEMSADLEHVCLSTLYARFGTAEDPRFGAIRPLDFLSQVNAVVMEYVEQPTLAALLREKQRISPARNRRDLAAALRNAGAWLRVFHGLDFAMALERRQAARAEILAAFDEYADHLGRKLSSHAAFARIAAAAQDCVRRTMPEALPLAPGHSDFAARNIFVDERDRVTVFDAKPRWLAPIYEDITRLTGNLRTNKAQAYSGGRAFDLGLIRDCEQAFHDGYFDGEPLPSGPLIAYELLLLLDLWSAVIARAPGDSVRERAARAARRLADRFFMAEAERLAGLLP